MTGVITKRQAKSGLRLALTGVGFMAMIGVTAAQAQQPGEVAPGGNIANTPRNNSAMPSLPSSLPPAGVTVQAVVPGSAAAGVQGLDPNLAALDPNSPAAVSSRATAGATLSAEYSRQVFSYPTEGRGDPVQPPSSLGNSSSEENLSVAGIIMNSRNPRLSKAMIRARGFSKARYAVMAGDRIDQYTVIEVKTTSVILAVPVLGGVRTLELQRSRDRSFAEGRVDGGEGGNKTIITDIPVPGARTVRPPSGPMTNNGPPPPDGNR